MKKKLLLTIAIGFVVVGSNSIVYSEPSPPPPPPDILTSDVSLQYYDIDGKVVSTNANAAQGGYHNPQSKASLNIWDDTYSFIAKTNGPATESGFVRFGDYDLWFNIITLEPYESKTDSDGDGFKDVGGDFLVKWKGENLPTYFDFVFGFGLGNAKTYDIAYYRFDDIFLSSINNQADGTYEMKIVNKSGKNIGALSHLMTYGIKGETPPPAVPEPATMLLFGTGLAGLAAVARRRKN